MGSPTLPSALLRFTSEFGMGSGGTIVLLSPGKLVVLEVLYSITSLTNLFSLHTVKQLYLFYDYRHLLLIEKKNL